MKYRVNDDYTSSNKEFAEILEQKQIKWTTATTLHLKILLKSFLL